MHWRHIKWRAPWRKRHLSVLEKSRAEDAAKEKAAVIQKRRDEAARRVTLERFGNQESTWNRCKRSIRCLRDRPWREINIGSFEHESVMSGGETAEMVEEEDMNNEDRQEFDNIFESWEGDYTSVLAEYGIC